MKSKCVSKRVTARSGVQSGGRKGIQAHSGLPDGRGIGRAAGLYWIALLFPHLVIAQEELPAKGDAVAPPLAAEPGAAADATMATIPVETQDAEAAALAEPERRKVGVGIEEIIVTAQKREEAVNDIPISISAFSGDALASLGVTDSRDLSRLVPGFSANESGGNTTIYTLRGVGFNDTTYTATGTVGTYIDEVNLPYSVMTRGANLDVQRVEVLKGPQGTLYGRNTTGGLINYIPNAPTDAFEAGTHTSYGRYNTLDTENYVSGPLGDSVRGRLSFRLIHSGEGYQRSQSRPDETLGKQNKGSARALIDWDAADNLSVRFALNGFYDKGEPQAPQVVGFICQNPFVGCLALSTEYQNYPVFPAKGDDPSAADWAPYDWRINDSFVSLSAKPVLNITDTMSLTTTVSALQVKSDGTSTVGGLPQFNADTVALFAKIRTVALESRLSDLTWDDRLRWSLGFNVSKDDGEEAHHLRIDSVSSVFPFVGYYELPEALRDLIPPNGLGSRFIISGTNEIQQGAVFVNTDTELSDVLSLNLGARYSQNKVTATGCSAVDPEDPIGISFSTLTTAVSAITAVQYTAQTGMPGQPSVILPGDCFAVKQNGSNEEFRDELKEDNLSGRAALTYRPDDPTTMYASISRGFKAGGYPVLNATQQAQYEPVKQEELLAYEAGIKRTWADGMLQTNAAVYYYDYKDKQLLTKLLDPIFGPLPVLKNAPSSHVYGAELDVQIAPVEGLYVALAAAYVKTRIDEFVSTNSFGETEDFSGNPFNFSPETTVSLVADYTWPINENLEIGFGGDYSYTSDTNASLDELPVYAMQSSNVFGARIHLGHYEGTWMITAFGRNLTNEYIPTGVFNAGDPVARFSALPRTYGLTFTYRLE